MRIRHFIAPAFALLMVVPAAAQDAPMAPMHGHHYHHYDYEITPTYASYHGLGMPDYCCGTPMPHHGPWWASRHVGHCSACAHRAIRPGWLGHRLALRHGCRSCEATACCGTHVQKGAVQKSAPVQKAGPVQRAVVQKAAPVQRAVVQKAAPVQKSPIQRHLATQRAHVPARMMFPHTPLVSQKAFPVVQKAAPVVQKSHPVVQKAHPIAQKGHWQKSADCCGTVAHGWHARPTLCERLHARRALRASLRMQAWDTGCCSDVKGGKGGMLMQPYYAPPVGTWQNEDEGSILIPDTPEETEPTSLGPTA